MHHIFRQNSVALNKQKPFVLSLQLLALLLRLNILLIHGCVFALLAALLEVFVEDEGQRGELSDRLVDAPRAHIVVRRVLALVVVDEVEAVALGRVGKFERLRA